MSFKWPFKKAAKEEISDENEVAEQPAEEAPAEVAEQPAEEAPAEVAEQPAQETPGEVAEQPVEEAPAEVAEQLVEEAPAEVAEQPAQETPGESTEQPQEETPKKSRFRFGKGRSRKGEEKPQPAQETPTESAEQPVEEAPAEAAEQPAQEAPAEQPLEEAPAETQSLRPSHGKLRTWLHKIDSQEHEEQPAQEAPAEVAEQPAREAPQSVEEAPQSAEEAPQPPRKRPRPAREQPQPEKERPRRPAEDSEPEEHRGQSLKSELTAVFVEFVRNGPRIAASVGGFLVVLVLLLSMNSKVKEGLQLLQQPQQPAEPVAGETVQQQDAATQEQTPVSAPTQPVMAPLAQQDIRIELGIEDTEEGPAVRTCVDMGGFYDVAVAHVSYDENNCFSGARIDLREAENCVSIQAGSKLVEYSHCEGVIQVDIAVDQTVLAAMAAEEKPQYEWFYRTDEEDEWEELDQKLFMVSDDLGKVTYLAEDLEKVLDSDEVAQFRLVYRRYNAKGGSLIIEITGLTVSDAALEEALSEEEE